MASVEKAPADHAAEVERPSKTADDEVAPAVVGGDYRSLPKGYYTSANFIGTVAVSTLRARRRSYIVADASDLGLLPWVDERVCRLRADFQSSRHHQ